jgi:hypothetical protein
MAQEKESEYEVSLARTVKNNNRELAFAFRTLREFTTFQYNLQIENIAGLRKSHPVQDRRDDNAAYDHAKHWPRCCNA